MTTSALSEHFGVRQSSVTSMVKKLSGERPKLLDIGSVPNAVLTVSKAYPTPGTLSIDIIVGRKRRRHVIGTQLADKIFVFKRE